MIDKKAEEAQIISCLNWDIHLLLPLDISTLGSWVFVHALSPPDFQALGSELELHQQLSRVFSYRLQIVGLLSLYVSQSLIINLFPFIYLSIYLIGFVCMENSNTTWKGGSIRRKLVVVQISQ